MKPHKWAKEIKAWADGEKIQFKVIGQDYWHDFNDDDVFASVFDNTAKEFRIRPQLKPDVYLYVYFNKDIKQLALDTQIRDDLDNLLIYVGKIKLEQDDE